LAAAFLLEFFYADGQVKPRKGYPDVSQSSTPERAKRLAAPIIALAFSIFLAMSTARVTFGPLFYFNDDKGVPQPQIVGNPGAVTGAVIFFLVFPCALWFLARLMGEDSVDNSEAPAPA